MSLGQKLSSVLQKSRLLWTTDIARMHHRNNIIVANDTVIASTSGAIWDRPDALDGIYGLSLSGGVKRWFFHSDGDANEIAYVGGVILGGTDRGQAFALDAETGQLIAEYHLDCPIYMKPVLVPHPEGFQAVTISYEGDVISFDLSGKTFNEIGKIKGRFRANAVTSDALAQEGKVIVASENARVFEVCIHGGEKFIKLIYEVPDRKGTFGDYMLRTTGVGSLQLYNNSLIISYLRETYDARPPLVCIDLNSGKELWRARPVKTLSRKLENIYGNSRVAPLVVGDLIYTTFSYNGQLHVFSAKDGKGLWMLRLDDGFYQNWASPVLKARNRIYVPRVNGLIHEIDTSAKKIMSTISVEVGRYMDKEDYMRSHSPQDDYDNDTRFIYEKEKEKDAKGEFSRNTPWPDDILQAGIAATPVVSGSTLLIGGISGQLKAYAV